MKARILSVVPHAMDNRANSWRICNLAKVLQERGYAIDLVQYVKKRPQKPTDLGSWGLTGIRTSTVQSPRLATLFVHFKEVMKNDYDLVIGNTTNGAFFSLLGRPKAPLLFDLHGVDAEEYRFIFSSASGLQRYKAFSRSLLFAFAGFLAYRLSCRIFCVSYSMIRYLANKGIPAEKLIYVPNFVDLSFFRPIAADNSRVSSLREELGIAKDVMLFGYLGAFDEWQGVERLIEAAKLVVDKRFLLLIVGGSESKQEGQVVYVPSISRERMPFYYSLCDFLVLPRPDHPATQIAAPTKFAEYAAMGKPILTTEVGDAARFVRKYGCGMVLKDNRPRVLAEGMASMMKITAGKLLTLAAASRAMAEREFDRRIAADNLEQCIDDLIAHRKR